MIKKIQLSLLLLIFTIFGVIAQKKGEIRNLQIGDQVPNIHIEKILNGNIKKAKIGDFKDQLLILDFMHTGCGGCLHALPGMDSLQSKFGDKIKILVVTQQKKNFVQKFLNNKDEIYGKLQIPWVVEDNILKEYFNYRIISHLVWIYKGEVVAITTKDYVTAENIQAILSGQEVNLPVKRDLLAFDFGKPFFNVEAAQGENERGLLYYSAFRGYIEGIDAVGKRIMVDSANNTIRLHIANRSILNLYSNAWKVINPSLPFITKDRLIWEVNDPSRYEYLEEYNRIKNENWERENAITYESVLPLKSGKQGLNQKLIDDLDVFFGLHGRWEKRKIPCYVIVKTGTDQEIEAKKEQLAKLPYIDFNGIPHNGAESKNDDASVFRHEFNLMYLIIFNDQFNRPLIDESQYKGSFIFSEYRDEKKDLMSFKKGLQKCGFDIVEKDCETDVFVLTEVWSNE